MTITALTTRLRARGTLTTARDGGAATFEVDEGSSHEIANGTGAGQANAVYVDDFSIAASGTLTIDLSGTLADPNNNTIVFTAVKEIIILADPTNTNNIVVGGATNAFVGPFADPTDKLNIKPGGRLDISEGYSAAGWAVGAGATDELKLANSSSGTAVAGTIVVIGEA